MTSAEFTKSAEGVKNLTTKPSNDDLLQLYAHFKQATIGEINTGMNLCD